MLVLSRQLSEEIVIAGDIRVTVVAVDGNRVRLGITAPTSVPVARLELLTECSGAAAPRFGRENGENRRSPGAR